MSKDSAFHELLKGKKRKNWFPQRSHVVENKVEEGHWL